MNARCSVAAIRKASLAEIASTPGIGEKIAQILFDYLASISGAPQESIDTATGEIRSH